jgi:threonine/homoserine/homoserine lactone efflux protein
VCRRAGGGVRGSDVSVEFLLASLVVAIVPGTGVVYTISSALGGGWRRGSFAAIGCTPGVVPHVLAAMVGLSGVMQAGAIAFEAVRWAGVAYLVYMGVLMIRAGGALKFDDQSTSTDSVGQIMRRGILLNLLNPKLTVFFFAFLPQFLDTPPRLLDIRLIGLGSVFMLTTLAVFITYAWASAAVRERVLGAPLVLRWVRRSLGTLLIGFAARLAITDR